MKNLIQKIGTSCNKTFTDAAILAGKHRKMLTFAYFFAFLFSCFPAFAFAAGSNFDNYPLWKTTQVVLDILFPIFIVVGVILLIVGIILFFISRFNEQSITGPLIITAVGVGLIVIRVLLGDFISEIAFEQMYPNAKWNNGNPVPR